MARPPSPPLASTACAFIIACGNGNDVQRATGVKNDGSAGASAEGGAFDDPDPVITDDARKALGALRYDSGPPPEDQSNRVADDAAARTFGQTLFFDRSLSG